MPDPSVREFLDLRLALARVGLSEAFTAERLEEARGAMSDIGRSANQAIRRSDVRRADDLFAGTCLAAWSEVAKARLLLDSALPSPSELVRARRALYRGLCLVAEGLSATSAFATFVTQVVAATRASPEDVAWALEVSDAELGIALAHPTFGSLSTENKTRLRTLRGEIAAWSEGDRSAAQGHALLNRLVLLVDFASSVRGLSDESCRPSG